jgi:septum site-determining protein MinD
MAARVLTISSGKGGVGKTTAVANIAVALASLGQRVVCVDGDIGLRNLDVVMGLENRIVYDLVDVVEGRCRLRQAMIRDKRLPDLYLIPAAQTRDKSAVSPSDMVRLAAELRPECDWVLIDSPAGIERGFRNAIAGADQVLVITNPEVSAVRDADRVIGLLEAEGKGPPMLVINRLNQAMVKRGDMLSVDDVLDLLAIRLIGIVPEDESVIIASNRGQPIAVDGKTRAGLAFQNIARRLMGEQVPLMNFEEQDGFWMRLSRLAGRK